MPRKRKRGWGEFKKQRVPPEVQELLDSYDLINILEGLRLASYYVDEKKWLNIRSNASLEIYRKAHGYKSFKNYHESPSVPYYKIQMIINTRTYERREDQPIIEFKKPHRPDSRTRITEAC